MSLSADQVRKVAMLARLQVDDEQLPAYARELSGILELAAALQAAETDDVTPMAHPLDLAARLRDDAVTEDDRRDVLQMLAPDSADGLYLVPRVIE